jgi:hypothetical protein
MVRDPDNEYGTGYDITVWSSDDKMELPHGVSSKEYYRYYVEITINSKFVDFYRSNQWKVLEDITDQFENITVGVGTGFEGHYFDVTLNYYDKEEKYQVIDSDTDEYEMEWDHYEYEMNVFGFPKEFNGDEYEDFMLAYYDEDNNPVYYK